MANMAADAYGGWITLTLTDGGDLSGELIALSDDELIICLPQETRSVARSAVSSARLIMFNTQQGSYATWTALNSLASLTNGFYLILTLPLNLITGSVTASAEGSRENVIDYPKNDWDELRKYARFPQGLPEGVALTEILPRPLPKK